jgi:hypothetical protein
MDGARGSSTLEKRLERITDPSPHNNARNAGDATNLHRKLNGLQLGTRPFRPSSSSSRPLGADCYMLSTNLDPFQYSGTQKMDRDA